MQLLKAHVGVYVRMHISASARAEAHLRNGSRPGHWPLCTALGMCTVDFLLSLERLAQGLYVSGGVLLSDTW